MGGLHWAAVRPRIERALSDLSEVHVVIYQPDGAPAANAMVSSQVVPKMSPGKAALIPLMDRHLAGLLDPFVTLLEVHKLMYFMQAAGQPLRLRYVKAPYGPYAENLRHVLKQIEGHWISGYADGGDARRRIEVLEGAVTDTSAALEKDPAARRRFDRVADLVEGFETPFGLELLSTVHWVVQENGAATLKQVVEQTHNWNERKRQFLPNQIQLAFEILSTKGWFRSSSQSSYNRSNA